MTSNLGIKKTPWLFFPPERGGFFSTKSVGLSQGQRLKLSRAALLVRTYPTLQGPTFRQATQDGGWCLWKKHSTFFLYLVVWRWGVFFCKPPTLEQVFESERLHVFFLKLLANFQLRIETTFFSNRKFRVQKLHVVFFVQVGATRKLPPFSEASKM